MAYIKGELKREILCDDTEDIYLPHSCDEWVIGGKKEAQDLVDDLIDIIKTL